MGSGTREAIAAAAQRQFGELGYRRASRSIAVEAGVDPRWCCTSSAQAGAVRRRGRAPVRPGGDLVCRRASRGSAGLATFLLDVLDSPDGRKTITGLIRAAASEDEAAAMIRELIGRRLLLPLASRLGRDRPELRASLVGSRVVGLAMARHVVGIPALTNVPGRADRGPRTSSTTT